MSLTWTKKINGGPQKVNHAAVCIDGYIYSFGGYCTGEDFEVRRDIDVHRFDTVNLKWLKMEYGGDAADIPYQRYGHSAVGYKSSCVIYGGRNDVDGVSEDVYKFDTVTRRWSRPEVFGELPLARDGHSCTVIGHTMYLFGGFEEKSMSFSKTVYTLNLSSYVWSLVVYTGVEPVWRDFHSATTWKHYMIVFGGRSDEYGPYHSTRETYDNNIYLYNSREHHWTRPEVSGDVPPGRRSHCAFEHGDKLYVFGGYNSILGKHYNDIHAFDPEDSTWSLCRPGGVSVPRARRRACCCISDDLVYIFGGTSPDPVRARRRRGPEPLEELSDVNILDMSPSLRTLCMISVVKHKLLYEQILPVVLIEDLKTMMRRGRVHSRVPNG